MREIPDSHIFTAFLGMKSEKMKNSEWTLLYENQSINRFHKIQEPHLVIFQQFHLRTKDHHLHL